MVWGAVIGAGASLLGGVLGNSAQSQTNRTNVRLAREQREWEERMANTSYQRGTEDLKKAGLNPMLAYSQGGATTPNVSAATVQAEDGMARGVSSAGDKAMQAASLEQIAINNKILQEKLSQEKIATDNLKTRYGVTGGTNIIDAEMNKVRDDAEAARATAAMRKTEAEMKVIEKRILESTEGYNVNSARARAELLDKEVNIAEMKHILMGLEIPEKEAMAAWFNRIGEASPAARMVMSIGQWLKMIFGGR